MRVLETLEVVEEGGKRVFRCSGCLAVLCPVSEDYKDYALMRQLQTTEMEAQSLAFPTEAFVIKEYYCPRCATMFEVDMTAADEKQIHSINLE